MFVRRPWASALVLCAAGWIPSRRACVLLTILALQAHALAPHRAWAEPAEAAPDSSYREAVDEALREYAEGRFEEARALFARAHGLYPNARAERGLGMTEFELRHYTECIRWLEAALRSEVRPLEGDLRAETEQLLARAEQFVGRFDLALTPAAAQLIVDGSALPAPESRRLVLSIGDHVIEAKAPEHLSVTHRVHVIGGESKSLAIVLPRVDGPAKVTTAPAPPPREERTTATPAKRRWYRSPWLWTAVGTVAAGAATGIAIAATRGTAPVDRGSTGESPLPGP